MAEKIFNIFLHINDNIITDIGVVLHEIEGDDSTKLSYLQENVIGDFEKAKKFPPPKNLIIYSVGKPTKGLHYDRYMELCQIGKRDMLFQEIFQYYKAPLKPLMCITPVVDGEIKIDAVERF